MLRRDRGQQQEAPSDDLAQLEIELAEKARHLRRTRDEIDVLECRIRLQECARSATLLHAALISLVQRANEQEIQSQDWGRNRIQNCQRAIRSALFWAGETSEQG